MSARAPMTIEEMAEKLAALERANAALRAENAGLRAELAHLKGEPPTDPSRPSGMTPPYEKANAPRNPRWKKPGRPEGHQGAHRERPARVDRQVHHTLCRCPDCGTRLGRARHRRKRYTEDLPQVRPEVTEHEIDQYWCPNCRKAVEAPVKEALPRATLGLRVMVITAWMHYGLGVTVHNVVRWLRSVCDMEVTAGGLTLAWANLADRCRPLYEEIRQDARGSAALHADETGWRVRGRTWWLWCFATPRLVYYVIAPSRASPVILRVLGRWFEGVLVTDFYAAYNRVAAWAKQRCVAHLLRELERVTERNPSDEWRGFARAVKRVFQDALRLHHERGGMSAESFDRRWRGISDRLDAVLRQRYRDRDCNRLGARLGRHLFELFTFLFHDGVDPTNNLAERMIRPAVVSRKNSYCNRSRHGAETQAILMSVLRTLHLRGIDPVEHLVDSLGHHIESGEHLPMAA